MYIGDIEKNSEIIFLKNRLSQSVENIQETLSILKEMFLCESVELLFYNHENKALIDLDNKNIIKIQHLDKNSLLGKSFIDKRSFISNDILEHKQYNIAIDNPYKITIRAQILLCVLLKDQIQGIVRLSHNKKFDKKFTDRIPLFSNTFKDIFLNAYYKKSQEIQETAFNKKTTEVYIALKKIKNLYTILSKQTNHPEVTKLIESGQKNIDTLFQYVNPNIDNISMVKRNLQKLKVPQNNNHSREKIRVLIADDVIMNVKILNSMLMDEDIEDIQFAYDGIETIEKMLASYSSGSVINVLFLDHHMPGKVGSEVAEILRDKGEPLYIVSITNDPDAISEKHTLYDFHISKPFTKLDVVNAFSNIRKRFHIEKT